MVGSTIRSLRESLGHEPYVFAKVLGVHVSTLYRWEQTDSEVRMGPLQANILEQLQQLLAKKRAKETKELGQAVLKAFLVGGTLAGLACLLFQITSPEGIKKVTFK